MIRCNLNRYNRVEQQSGQTSLTLRFASVGGQTTLIESYDQAPMCARLLHGPSNLAGSGSARVAMLHNGGGILAGDAISTEVVLEQGAAVHLSTVGATRIHRTAPGDTRPSRIETHYDVGSGANLIVLPDAIIPFAESRLAIKTTAHVARGGTCIIGEIIAAGRVARQEMFAWHSLCTDFALSIGGRLCVLDRIHLPVSLLRDAPFAAAASPTAILAWGQYTHMGNLWICAPTADAALAEHLHHHIQNIAGWNNDLVGSATKANGPVVVARLLGHSASDLKGVLADLTTVGMARKSI